MATATPSVAQPPKTDLELVRQSGFAFLGTVKELGAATPTVVREANTAVVFVDHVLEALPPVGNVKGKEVTVRLLKPDSVKVGQKAIFFTQVYSAGKSLGVQEVGMLPPQDEKDAVARVRAARQALVDDVLARRLASAQLVVVGTIGEAKPTEGARERTGEHDPLWWRAPIEMTETLKGNLEGRIAYVHIAESDDPVWEHAPKPKAGTKAVFLLQPDQTKKFRVQGLFLLDASDVLALSELERVRRLMKK